MNKLSLYLIKWLLVISGCLCRIADILFHVVILTVRDLVRSFALTHILGSPLFIASLLSFVTPEIKMIIFMADKMWTLQFAMISLWRCYKWCHARSGHTEITAKAEPWWKKNKQTHKTPLIHKLAWSFLLLQKNMSNDNLIQ